MNRRADIIVSGVVQGVGFRYMVRGAARQCQLKGEVENLEDDTVRITCEGEEGDIGKLVEEVRNAKKPIEVDDVQVEYSEPTGGFKNFRIIMGDQLTEMSEGFGTGSAYLRIVLDKQDAMLDKQDAMLDKQDVVASEIRSLSSNMHDMMDARFQRLEDEIAKIKAKLP